MLTRTIANIAKTIFLLWFFCVVLQLVFQFQFHNFLWISALWLGASIFVIFKLYGLTNTSSNLQFRWVIFLLSFFWGLLLIYISSETLDYFRGIPFIGLDDVVYQQQQVDIANRLNAADKIEVRSLMSGYYSGYPNFGGLLMYFMSSTHWAVPRITTVLMFSISSLFFHSIMQKCYSSEASRLTTLIYAFSPMFIYYAIFQLKDSLIIFFLLMAILGIINIAEGKKTILSLCLITLALAFIIPIRAMIIVSFLLSVFVFMVLFKTKRGRIQKILIFGLSIIGVVWIWNSIVSTGLVVDPQRYFDMRFDLLGDSDTMAGKNSTLAKGGLVALVSAPLFILLSPFVPIPTALMFEHPLYPSLNSEFSGNLFLYALIPFFVMGVIYWYKNRAEYKYVPFFIILFGVYKVGAALSGMTLWSFRQTLPATLALLMIVPISFEHLEEKRGWRIVVILLYILIFAWSAFRYFIRN